MTGDSHGSFPKDTAGDPLSLGSPELAPYLRSPRSRTLLQVLLKSGLSTFEEVARLSRSELRDLPGIGAQEADEIITIVDRIHAGRMTGAPASLDPFPESRGHTVEHIDRHIAHDEGQDRESWTAPPAARRSHPSFAPSAANSLGREFPDLALIAARRLSDPLLRAAWLEPGDDLAHSWLTRTGASVIADLLPLTRQNLLNLRGIGPSKVRRLNDYLGRLAAAAPALATWDDPATEVAGPEHAHASSTPDVDLEVIVSWARSVGNASTWGEALAMSDQQMPADVAKAWEQLLIRDLPERVEESPLKRFLEEDPRRARILLGRFASSEPRTLQELADEFAVSRERTRQIETRGVETLRMNFEISPDWRTVRWAAERLAGLAGAYAPGDVLERVLPGWNASERLLIARLAGYQEVTPALVRNDLQLPKVADLPTVAHTEFVVDEYELIESLQSSGVLDQHIDFVLGSIAGTSRVDGQLVRWGGSIVNKVIAILEVRDEPQDVDQLVIAAYGEGGSRSARNRVLEDSRMMRVTKNKVGLSRWGGAHYRGVAELMLERLASGPMDLTELADELARRYEISSASVRMYAAAPAFKVTGDVIALRSRRDPYSPRSTPWRVRGLYRDPGTDTTVWIVAVDPDMLRGSGRSVPQEIASDLALLPGERTELRTAAGPVPVAWSETTHSGPHIGSLRELAVAAGASLGDQLALRFKIPTSSLEVRIISSTPSESLSEDLARLTTLPTTITADRKLLAEAVGTAPLDLLAALEKRGDTEVASLVARFPDLAT